MLRIKSSRWVAMLAAFLLLGLGSTDRAEAADCQKVERYRSVTMQVVHDMMTRMSCKAMRTEVFCPLWTQLQSVESDVLNSMIACRAPDRQIQQMKASVLKGDEFARRYCPFMSSAL
jgi:hypothetical protein